MATSKVVRLEEVSSLDDNFSRKLEKEDSHVLLRAKLKGNVSESTMMTSAALEYEKSSLSSKPSTGGQVVALPPDTAESLALEAADTLRPLPKDWPRLPQVLRQKEYTKALCTAVNKATAHLELLQNIIDEWFDRQVASRGATRLQSEAARGGRNSFDRRHLRFTTPSIGDQWSLRIDGVGGVAENDSVTNIRDAYGGLDIPYLGAEEVLEEVMTLLGKLETERQDTSLLMKKQRQVVKQLGAKINELAEHRMNEMPKAVQREHEACSRDIYELQWHISYRGRSEDRVRTKMEIADALNVKLKEDIAFVNKHCPLVEEKLDLERAAMERIEQAQTETTEELNLTLERLARVEKKSDEAHNKANLERNRLRDELEAVNAELNKICQDLADSKSRHESHVHRIYSTREQLKVNEQEITVLEVKEENAKTAEAMQAKKVKDLEIRIAQQEEEHKKLVEDNLQKQSDIAIQAKNYQYREEELQKEVYKLEDKHSVVERIAAEFEMDLEDMNRKLEDCARQKIDDEKNVIRIRKEMEKTKKQMKVTMEEYGKVEAINNAIREKWKTEENKALQIEDSLKVTADALKKQVKDEIHARTVLQARIGSDGQELVKSKAESKGKREKVQKVASEIENAVKTILGKVEKLRDTHAEKSSIVNGLHENIAEVKKNHKETESDLNGRLGELTPHATHLKDDIMTIEKKIDHIEWRAEMMQKKMDDMGASSSMMTRLTETTEKAIHHLTSHLDELTLQFEAGQKLEDELRTSLNEINCRIRDYEVKHKQFLEARAQVSQQLEKDLETNKKSNKELASKYRKLQNHYMILKDKLLNRYEERIQLENTIKDLKQLESLQQKMHNALSEYYKYRGLYNQGELDRLEAEAVGNGIKLFSLQDEMNVALEDMSKFLLQQMDPSVVKKMASAALASSRSVTLVS